MNEQLMAEWLKFWMANDWISMVTNAQINKIRDIWTAYVN